MSTTNTFIKEEIMADYTIYSNEIWEQMLEKYPDLRDLTIKCGCENDPQKAKKIRDKIRGSFGSKISSCWERKLANCLASIEFREYKFLRQVILTGTQHYNYGSGDYVRASFDLVLSDFNDSFKDWYTEVQKRNMSENSSFEEFYNVFLDVIKLKLDYKIPYTKLFISKLLENSDKPKEDSLEIKNYFLRICPELFPEIRSELIE